MRIWKEVAVCAASFRSRPFHSKGFFFMFTSSELLDKINVHLVDLKFSRSPEGLYAPVSYVLSLGGKRIRPVLMLLAYNLYKEDVESIFNQATGIEVYHNYTLLHDDLMDKADRRRGKPTVHKVWNENTAILSGDAMLVLAYRYMAEGCPVGLLKPVMDLFGQTALEICEGQQFDMEFESRNDVSEAEYLEMIRLKTSVLLAASLKLGALLGGAPQEDAERLYDFGVNLGLAFQLKDDWLDVYGDPKVFGKNIGGDILCNKNSYLLIQALERASDDQRKELERWLAADEFVPAEKIAAVTRLYDAIGVGALCEEKIQAYTRQAEENLLRVEVEPGRKQELQKLMEALMRRNV